MGGTLANEPPVAADGVAEFRQNLTESSSRRRGDGEQIHCRATAGRLAR